MTYIIAQPCVDVKDKSCIEECPVDCIYEGDRMLYIQPDECVDCGACEPVCPVEAIYYEDDVPSQWKEFSEVNSKFFVEIGSPGGAAKMGPTGKDHATVAALPPQAKQFSLKLPDFPWDLLSPYGDKAKKFSAGFIDLSQGTPVDATPKFIQDAFIAAADSPSYPLTIGTPELRTAMRNWATNKLGATGDFDVLPTIGSKEFVAWLPTFLQSKSVLYPEVAYPTYLVGSMISGATAHAVGIDANTWPKAELAWINSPSNPTGQVQSEAELAAVINWSRQNNAIVASDECYISFAKGAKSILAVANGNNTNLISVHSLSKRSNLAGYRAAFVVGDSKLIAQIREIRKHAGMMVPLPVQKAMVAALSDETHVSEQENRYNQRRAILKAALEKSGFKIEFSEAGLYIWCTRNEDCWSTVDWFADRGVLVTPGVFYGEQGSKFVRIALTATDENIGKTAERILN